MIHCSSDALLSSSRMVMQSSSSSTPRTSWTNESSTHGRGLSLLQDVLLFQGSPRRRIRAPSSPNSPDDSEMSSVTTPRSRLVTSGRGFSVHEHTRSSSKQERLATTLGIITEALDLVKECEDLFHQDQE